MTAPDSISAAADVDDVPFSRTCLVFTLCIFDPLQVEGVSGRFIAFVDAEDRTIMLDIGSVSVARGEQGHNPYATITKTRTVILKQRERIKFLIRALNNVYLYLSTPAAASDLVLSVLLADGGDDDNEDNGVNGRLHSVSIARFEQGHDNDDNNDDNEDNNDNDHDADNNDDDVDDWEANLLGPPSVDLGSSDDGGNDADNKD
jgi:hypothetical protein